MSNKSKKSKGNPAKGAKAARAYEAPVMTTASEESDAAPEREHLFTIDGVAYTIAKKPNVNIALGYLGRLDTKGEEAAIGYLLMGTLGVDAFDALTRYEGLDEKDLQAIINRVKAISLGGLEDPKGS